METSTRLFTENSSLKSTLQNAANFEQTKKIQLLEDEIKGLNASLDEFKLKYLEEKSIGESNSTALRYFFVI